MDQFIDWKHKKDLRLKKYKRASLILMKSKWWMNLFMMFLWCMYGYGVIWYKKFYSWNILSEKAKLLQSGNCDLFHKIALYLIWYSIKLVKIKMLKLIIIVLLPSCSSRYIFTVPKHLKLVWLPQLIADIEG